MHKLKAHEWKALGAPNRVVEDAHEVHFAFISQPEAGRQMGNHPSAIEHKEIFEELLEEYHSKNIIQYQDELIPQAPHNEPQEQFVHLICPMAIVPKHDGSKRPVIDPTKAGLNQCLAPWGMQLPTPKELLQHLPTGAFLAKRDWKHGFHQLTLAPTSRRYMGFKHPASGRIGRFVALPFGAAQSPGRFTDVAVIFARLLFQRAQARDLTTVGLAQYIDDLLLWATDHS